MGCVLSPKAVWACRISYSISSSGNCNRVSVTEKSGTWEKKLAFVPETVASVLINLGLVFVDTEESGVTWSLWAYGLSLWSDCERHRLISFLWKSLKVSDWLYSPAAAGWCNIMGDIVSGSRASGEEFKAVLRGFNLKSITLSENDWCWKTPWLEKNVLLRNFNILHEEMKVEIAYLYQEEYINAVLKNLRHAILCHRHVSSQSISHPPEIWRQYGSKDAEKSVLCQRCCCILTLLFFRIFRSEYSVF